MDGRSDWSLGPVSNRSFSEKPELVTQEALNTTLRGEVVLVSRSTGDEACSIQEIHSSPYRKQEPCVPSARILSRIENTPPQV